MYVINRIIHWCMDVCTVQRQLIAFKSCIYIKATIVDLPLRDSRTFCLNNFRKFEISPQIPYMNT